jgi:hypothetical protein
MYPTPDTMSLEDHFRSLSRIELRIFSPMQPIKMVSVRCGCQIGSLQKLWPSPRRIIFNGLELDDLMTFGSYGLQDGDALVVVSRGDREGTGVSPWISVTRDYEGFNDSLQWALDLRTATESARLADLRKMRFENKIRAFRRFSPAFLENQQSPAVVEPSEVDYPAPGAPSTSALPVSWEPE